MHDFKSLHVLILQDTIASKLRRATMGGASTAARGAALASSVPPAGGASADPGSCCSGKIRPVLLGQDYASAAASLSLEMDASVSSLLVYAR
jgi:hypothetical protein